MIGFVLLAVLDLGTLFAQKESWTGKSEFFAVEHAKEGFVFASEDREIVNCLKHDTCTWHGLQVWEAKVYFDKSGEEERVARVELSLYNRGDAGDETLDVAGLKAKIDAVAKKVAPDERKAPSPEKTTLRNGGLRFRRAFAKADPAAELVWGLSAPDDNKVRTVEYLRLTLTPKGEMKAKSTKLAKRAEGKAGKAKIKDNVTKSPNGDVYIDNVPMVDQGQKGYCAAATAERVLKYYGVDVDEHTVAQAAGTTADGGTSVLKMRDAIREIGKTFHLSTKVIYGDFDQSVNKRIESVEDEVKAYNRMARRMKKKPIEERVYTLRQGNTIVYNGNAAMAAMDPEVRKEMKRRYPKHYWPENPLEAEAVRGVRHTRQR